jgi:hypothetical protein
MTSIRARIDRDGNRALENVLVALDVRTEAGGLRSWQGSFRAPFEARIDIGDELQFTLADGRSGQALIRQITQTSGDANSMILFQGTGPLA